MAQPGAAGGAGGDARPALGRAPRFRRGEGLPLQRVSLSVAVARDAYVAQDGADKRAALERNARSRQRIVEVSRVPGRQGGSHVLAYEHTPESREAVALYGSPDEIREKLEALHAVGVRYILASCAGSRDSLRRFAREIAPG